MNVSIDPLYYEISGASVDDWHAILPNVAGLGSGPRRPGAPNSAPDGAAI